MRRCENLFIDSKAGAYVEAGANEDKESGTVFDGFIIGDDVDELFYIDVCLS